MTKKIRALALCLVLLVPLGCDWFNGKEYRADVVANGVYVHINPTYSHLLWGGLAPALGWKAVPIGNYLRDNVGPHGGISEYVWDHATVQYNDLIAALMLAAAWRDCVMFFHGLTNSVDWKDEGCGSGGGSGGGGGGSW